jgi:hypothetical protein
MAIRSQMSSAYCGTKGAVRAMCPAIAKELVIYVCFPLLNLYFQEVLMMIGNSCQFHLSWLCED